MVSEMGDSMGESGGDSVDTLLRNAAVREPYIDDAGFTARVMTQLPAPANFAVRRWILLGFGSLAVACGLLSFGGGEYIWKAALELVTLRRFGSAQLGVLVFAAMFYWSIYIALRPGHE